MEDYIYTILVIAWIVYGVYKATLKSGKKSSSSKKPAHIYSQVEEEGSEKITNTMEELFEGVFPSMKTENDIIQSFKQPFDTKKEVKQPDMPPKNNLNEVLDSYDGTDHSQSVFAGNTSQDSSQSKYKESIENQSENIEHEEYNEQVDLRKAIIYQAILERPY